MSDSIRCHSPRIGGLTNEEWNINLEGFTCGDIQGCTYGGEWSKCGLL
jgi:hypothetical protein